MNVSETQGIYVTPSEVMEYLYCPRFIYFMNCLNIDQYEEQHYKVLKGRTVHEERRRNNPDYVRKKLGCESKASDVYMSSEKYRLKGKVDEILQLNDGTLAPLDYKYAECKEGMYRTHWYQSVLYALLIKDTYQQEVNRGYVCYVRSKSLMKEIEFKESDFIKAIILLKEIVQITQRGFFPKRTPYRVRCLDCCYRNICVR
ncbi:MAG: CRISPR-associated protein Cas4 [Nitrospirae bacterium]|nr:CRISPR-associated protein Cas4 [Nitrospirota bacterium]